MKKIYKITMMFLAIAMLMTVFIVPTEAAAKIQINKTKTTIYVGKTTTLKISGTTRKIKWSSSKRSVAVVSSKGRVTGKKAGKATITAKVGKKSYRCKVTVKNPYLNSTKKTLRVGNSYTLKITGTTAKKWTSSNKLVATVNSKGKVTAKKVGTATITCAGKNGKKYKCKITVKAQTTTVSNEEHTHSYNAGTVTKAATTDSVGIMNYSCSICGETITKEYGMQQTFTYSNRTADIYGYWDAAEAAKILNSINQYRTSKGYSALSLEDEYARLGKQHVEATYFNIVNGNLKTESGKYPKFLSVISQAAYAGDGYFDHYILKEGSDGKSNASLFESEDIEVAIGFFTEISYGTLLSNTYRQTYNEEYKKCWKNYYVAVCIYEK